MPWLGLSSSLDVISATVLPAIERELQMSMKLCLLAATQIFDHIGVARAKSAGWSAFKILCLNHSP